MKKKYLKYFVYIPLVGLLTTSFVIVSKNSNSLEAKSDICSHSGYHYEKLDPTKDTPGHKEFWCCCKCHESFLEQPEGNFITRSFAEIDGIFDSNHIAYLFPSGEETPSQEDEDFGM